MWKLPKQTIQITIDREDLEYLEDLGKRYNRKNPSQAISMLIKHTLQIEKKLDQIQSAANQQKPSYEDVRTQQIRRSPVMDQPPDPIEEPKWSFLKKARDQYDRQHNIEGE